MKKQTKIILAVLAVLVLAVGLLMWLNWDSFLMAQWTQEDGVLLVAGAELDYAAIAALPSETFEAVIRSSGQRPRQVTYRGAPLPEVLALAGADTDGCTRMTVYSADGYVVAAKIEDVYTEGNMYIAYEQNGRVLQPMALGGEGPYQLIVRLDPYSQRWAKYLMKLEFD